VPSWHDGGCVIMAFVGEIPGILRTVAMPGSGRILLGDVWVQKDRDWRDSGLARLVVSRYGLLV